MVRLSFIFFLIVFFARSVVFAAENTEQGVFNERVKSLQVHSATDNLSTGTPVIVLGTPEAIVIDFDILEDDRRYMRYELIHCNSNWQPSGLSYLEYLDGFNEGTIEDYEFSSATSVAYVHYRLVIPNEQLNIRLSGNYVVRIYDEEDPDETLIRARFSVSEQTAPISAFVTSRTDVDYNRKHQQIELEIDFERTPVSDIFSEVLVTVQQNGRPDAVHNIAHPLRISGRRGIYEHLPELIFEAGNEYRRFETVSNSWTGMNVDAVEYHAPYYNHYLQTDAPRSSSQYLYDQTLSGGYVVREYNSSDSDTEADYVVVHFSLEMPELFNTDIFIDSDAFNRTMGPESRMIYNRGTGRYEKAALLKQGAYSYQYLAVPQGRLTGNTETVEGDKYQTGNQYAVNVYTRLPGERYDRLIGHALIFSNQQY